MIHLQLICSVLFILAIYMALLVHFFLFLVFGDGVCNGCPMSSPSCRVAQLSPALGAEMIPCVMLGSLVGTSSCPFLAPLLLSFSPLTLYTLTFGPLPFRVSLVTSITWSSSMTAPTTHGLLRCARSLTPSTPFPTSSPLCPCSLVTPSGASSAIMDVSLITPPALSLSHGVQFWMSCPYTSSQNGKTESMIRTTNDVMCSLLFQASPLACYWAESLYVVTYLLNLLLTKPISAPTPHFALFGITPSYAHLQVCYPNTSATVPYKLAPLCCRCVFLGYSSDHKGCRCLDLTTNRMLIS
jgi:hypothetical protein